MAKKINIIYLDVVVIKVFMPVPFVAFISSQNLSSFLVRSNIYPLEKAAGFSNEFLKIDRFLLMFQKQIYFSISRQRGNIRLIINLMVMTNI